MGNGETKDSEIASTATSSKPNKRRFYIVFIVVIVIILAIIAFMKFSQDRSMEEKHELNDLLAMQCAESSAKVALARGDVSNKKTEYWLDIDSFSITPITSDKPSAYGEGTTLAGGGVVKYREEYGDAYEYDESADYTSKVIKVTIDPNVSEDKQITLEWVD